MLLEGYCTKCELRFFMDLSQYYCKQCGTYITKLTTDDIDEYINVYEEDE